MHSIGDIANVVLLGEITWPQRLEHLTRHATMNPTDTIHLLAEVSGQHTHRELLVRVVGVETSIDIACE